MGIIQQYERAFKKFVKLEKEAAKKYHAYEIAMSKRNKAYWGLERLKVKKKGRKING